LRIVFSRGCPKKFRNCLGAIPGQVSGIKENYQVIDFIVEQAYKPFLNFKSLSVNLLIVKFHVFIGRAGKNINEDIILSLSILTWPSVHIYHLICHFLEVLIETK
jgi:hypothetical protein